MLARNVNGKEARSCLCEARLGRARAERDAARAEIDWAEANQKKAGRPATEQDGGPAGGIWAPERPTLFHAVPLAPFYRPWVAGVAAAGALAVAWNARRMEFARFVTAAGVPAVIVGRAGPRAGEFDRFVARLEERVRRVGAAGPAGPSG
jgi:hypothetical protein